MGRTPSDVGTDEVREAIQRRLDVVIFEWEQKELQRQTDLALMTGFFCSPFPQRIFFFSFSLTRFFPQLN